jgi:hypothetical protein
VEPIAIRALQWFMLLGAVLGLGMTAVGLWLLLADLEPEPDPAVAWSAILFFGGCTVVLIYRFLRNQPFMELSDEGIVDHRLKIGPVPWSELEGAYIKRMLWFSFVCFQLRDPQAFLAELPEWRRELLASNRRLGGTEWAINVTGTGTSAQAVVDAVNRQVALQRQAGTELAG